MKAKTFLLPVRLGTLEYPDPQYTTPLAIAGPPATDEPLLNENRIFPVSASMPNMVSPFKFSEPPYTTPLATLTAPTAVA